MAADSNLMKSEDFAKVSTVDFVQQFEKGIGVLRDVLGITRMVEKQPKQVINTYKVSGKLESGDVDEGETIPLSKYKTEVAQTFTLSVKKWRKVTTFEAINDKGYDQAVTDTDTAMVRDIQAGIKKSWFDFMNAKTGKSSAEGIGLRGALAKTWGKLKVFFEDYDVADSDLIYLVHPLDVAEYLGDANNYAKMEEAFGLTYVQNFLGIYNLLIYTGVKQGTVVATAKSNVIMYYTNPRNSEVGKAFDLTVDDTGLVGVHRDVDYTNLTAQTVAVAGIALYAELLDGVVIGTIKAEAAASSGSGE